MDVPHLVRDACIMCIELEREQHVHHWDGCASLCMAQDIGLDVSRPDSAEIVHEHRMLADVVPLAVVGVPPVHQLYMFTDMVAGIDSVPAPDVLAAVVEDYAMPDDRPEPPPGRDLADVPGAVERRRVVAVTSTHDVVLSRRRDMNVPRLSVERAGGEWARDSLVQALRLLRAAY